MVRGQSATAVGDSLGKPEALATQAAALSAGPLLHVPLGEGESEFLLAGELAAAAAGVTASDGGDRVTGLSGLGGALMLGFAAGVR